MVSYAILVYLRFLLNSEIVSFICVEYTLKRVNALEAKPKYLLGGVVFGSTDDALSYQNSYTFSNHTCLKIFFSFRKKIKKSHFAFSNFLNQ